MKVLFLLDCNINTLGGAQNSMKTLVRVLSKKGIKIGIFMPRVEPCLRGSSEKYIDYVFLRRARGHHTRISQFVVEIKALRKCIMHFHPDIVHAQSARIAIMLGLMKRFRLLPKRTKIIVTDRGYLPEYKKRIFFGLKMVVGVYDAIVTTTKRNMSEWVKYYKCNNIICIPNVLDDDWFTLPESSLGLLNHKFDMHRKIYVGFSGRYEEYKRWDTVVEICKKLKDCKNIHFVVAITADVGVFRKQMRSYVTMLRQNFDKGLMTIMEDADRKEMMNFYDSIDIFVLTSRNESFGRTLIEAMARHTIAIGTDSGGVPEVINDRRFLFDVGDADGAVRIIRSFVDNPKLIPISKKAFYDYAKKNYREYIVAERHLELYRRELYD